MAASIHCCACCALAIGSAIQLHADAQVPVYNPYTGQGVARPAYNPLASGGSASPSIYNPYTGYQPVTAPRQNPYVGSMPIAEHGPNPLTGNYASRAQQKLPPGSFQREVPITGHAGPGLEHIDAAMLRSLERHCIPGAALAIAAGGKLVLARGYGWANLETGEPVRPDAVFAIASLSKCLTAATILKLADDGKLRLDDRAFALLPG